MNVVKPGWSTEKWSEQYKCRGTENDRGCDAVLLVGEDDILWMETEDQFHYPTGKKRTIVWRCCECGKINRKVTDYRFPMRLDDTLPRESPGKSNSDQPTVS